METDWYSLNKSANNAWIFFHSQKFVGLFCFLLDLISNHIVFQSVQKAAFPYIFGCFSFHSGFYYRLLLAWDHIPTKGIAKSWWMSLISSGWVE